MNQGKKSKRYHALKNRLFFIRLFVDIIILLVLLISGLSFALRNFSYQISENFLIANGIYIVIFMIGMQAIHLPLDFLEGFSWEHKFNLSNQKFSAWVLDGFKKAAIGGFIAVIMIEVIYLLLGKFYDLWWVGATLFWLFINLVLARLLPQVIIPLFYKYSDIKDESLRKRILALFEKCNVKIKNAYSINFSSKTKKLNAFLCGLGNNRRVVLSDNLLSEFTADEIEAVLAHEVGHYKHRDIIKITFVSCLVTFFSFFVIDYLLKAALPYFGLSRIDDIAFFPMMALAFLFLSLLVMPLVNAYSRYIETKADAFSINTTKRPADLISAFKKLGAMNLAEFVPNKFIEFLLYDHPPLAKRIEFAEGFLSPDNRKG